MPQPPESTRRLASAYVRSAVAVVVFGGVVAITLSPRLAESLTSPGVILLTLLVAGIAATVWVSRRVRRYRTNRARAIVLSTERRNTFLEINRLEELHEMPAYEPNRSTYTRKGA